MSYNAIEDKLSILREIQDKYPMSHVGGSIGLMLYGVDLKRDISASDLDITCPFLIDYGVVDRYQDSSMVSDFDGTFNVQSKESVFYHKIELRVSPEPSFQNVMHKGFVYNVSLYRDIIFWKEKYAAKGSQKHIDDLVVIRTGVRPEKEVKASASISDTDWDLPF